LDRRVTETMARFGVPFLRISLGIVFFWFGVLKFFPGLSPADQLASRTISALTLGIMPADAALLVLAVWECAIGLGLILGVFLRLTLLLLFLQMLGTFTPLLLFPDETFTRFPYAPTLEGQYIIKNLVLIAAGIIIGATVRGGHVEPEPEPEPERPSLRTSSSP
nr:DoxX family membrane protein [Chloroflexota bacterium]